MSTPTSSSRRSRLAIIIALASAAVGVRFILFLVAHFQAPYDYSVEPHRLFELAATSLITAGREVVRLRSNFTFVESSVSFSSSSSTKSDLSDNEGSSSSSSSTSKREKTQTSDITGASSTSSSDGILRVSSYPDGSAELHTIADARSHEVLSRLKKLFPALSYVDEEDEEGQWRLPLRQRRASGRSISAFTAGSGVSPDATVGGTTDGASSSFPSSSSSSTTTAVSTAALLDSQPDSAAPPSLRRHTIPLSELAVYVDPLDATQEYTEGLTEYVTLSACVVWCGRPVVGLILQPFTGRLYWTRPGTGVHVNFDVDTAVMAERSIMSEWTDPDADQMICCDERTSTSSLMSSASAAMKKTEGGADGEEEGADEVITLQAIEAWKNGLRIIGSRSHSGNTSIVKDIVESLMKRSGNIVDSSSSSGSEGNAKNHQPVKMRPPKYIKAGGAGFKMIELIEGRADAYLHPSGIRKWDLCAADALLRASGGKMTDWTGKPIDYCVYGRRNRRQQQQKTKKTADHNVETTEGDGVDEQQDDKETAADAADKVDNAQFLVGGVVAAGNVALHADLVQGSLTMPLKDLSKPKK